MRLQIVERQRPGSALGPVGPSALAVLEGASYLAYLQANRSGYEVRYMYPARATEDRDCDGMP